MRILILISALFIAPAYAQQVSPSQTALQITQIVAQWAYALEALQKQNADLHDQLTAVTKERDELKAKIK